MDNELRALERLAQQGDPAAELRLRLLRQALGGEVGWTAGDHCLLTVQHVDDWNCCGKEGCKHSVGEHPIILMPCTIRNRDAECRSVYCLTHKAPGDAFLSRPLRLIGRYDPSVHGEIHGLV